MDLTTVARVKALLPGITSITYDTLIDRWIDQVSATVERAINRTVLAGAQTEFFTVRPYHRVFQVRAIPVTAWTEVNNDYAREYGTATIIDADNYATWDDRGLVEFDRYLPVSGRKALRVKYTGGMAADTSAFVVAFPDLAAAVDAQVAHQVQRREQLGATSVSADGGSISVDDPTKWLPVLRMAVNAYRRQPVA